jgi:acyl carrier protein
VEQLEQELGAMIIETLRLEMISPKDIDPNQPLFNDGLGLDSIDGLELSLEISKRYGIQISAEHTDVANIFSSLRALAEFIAMNRQR